MCNRKRAKTQDEKEQRRIERVLRNRAAARASRERRRREVDTVLADKQRVEAENDELRQRLALMEEEIQRLRADNLAHQTHSSSTVEDAAMPASPVPMTHLTSSWKSPLVQPPWFESNETVQPSCLSLDFTPSLEIGAKTPDGLINHRGSVPHTTEPAPGSIQYPAEILCDLQCQPAGRFQAMVPLTKPLQGWLIFLLQLITTYRFQTMIQTISSSTSHSLIQVLWFSRQGRSLPNRLQETLSFSLMVLLITAPMGQTSKLQTQAASNRLRLLRRELFLHPTLARPPCDATSRALSGSVNKRGIHLSRGRLSRPTWLKWAATIDDYRAIDHIMAQRWRAQNRPKSFSR